MKSRPLLKQALYNACIANVEQRLSTINSSLASIQESKSGDTKSSAGDKFETGVAMMHLEEDKLKSQLHQANQVYQTIQNIDTENSSREAILGSLVITNKGAYYISIGIGKVLIDDNKYYCISPSSPIGSKLHGKAVGDAIIFNGNEMSILEIY